ncbi:hypothetical protein D3C81_1258960 [compost metagenome]
MAAVTQETRSPAGAPYGLADKMLRPFQHHAGEVAAGNPGQGGVGEAAEDVLHVARVEAGGAHLDQDFVGGGNRVGQLDQFQGGEVAGVGELQGLHG